MCAGPTCQRTSSAVWCCGPLRKLNVNKLSYIGYARSLRLPLHAAHQPPAYKIWIQRHVAMKFSAKFEQLSQTFFKGKEFSSFRNAFSESALCACNHHQFKVTVLSRAVRSLFGSTRKSSPWGNFSDGGLNQSIKRRISLSTFMIDWFIGFVPPDLFLRGGGG